MPFNEGTAYRSQKLFISMDLTEMHDRPEDQRVIAFLPHRQIGKLINERKLQTFVTGSPVQKLYFKSIQLPDNRWVRIRQTQGLLI